VEIFIDNSEGLLLQFLKMLDAQLKSSQSGKQPHRLGAFYEYEYEQEANGAEVAVRLPKVAPQSTHSETDLLCANGETHFSAEIHAQDVVIGLNRSASEGDHVVKKPRRRISNAIAEEVPHTIAFRKSR
jgi:hypothetical protein